MGISLSGVLYFSALASSNYHPVFCDGFVVCSLRATDRVLYKTPTSLVSTRLHFPLWSPCLGLFHAIPRSAFEVLLWILEISFTFGFLTFGFFHEFSFTKSASRILFTKCRITYSSGCLLYIQFWLSHSNTTLGM